MSETEPDLIPAYDGGPDAPTWFRRALAVPHTDEVVPVDVLPRNLSGKVLKTELRR